MSKSKKIGNSVTIVLAALGAFLLHPLASIPILFIGFKLAND